MTLKLTTALLQKIPLLEGLGEALLAEMLRFLQVHEFGKGDYVVTQGSAGGDLYFLLQGRLLVVDESQEGRQTGLNFLTSGDFFGELALIDDLPRSASVMAVAPSLVMTMPKAVARKIIYETPVLAERMLKHVAARLRATTDFRSILSLPAAHQRVFALVKLLAKPDPGKLLTIENMPTHQHLALMVNTSRETVSRAMQVLVVRGILQKDNRRLIVRAPQELQKLAQETQEPSQEPQDIAL
jgi:CRP/FNR family transcriptional regulator, cyclic AMP receptor protein